MTLDYPHMSSDTSSKGAGKMDTSDVDDLDPFDLLDTEAERVARFLEGLDEDGWTKPTRCEGWRVRELVSHVDGVELYHLACLNDNIQGLFAKAAEEGGVTDVNSFNDWVVRVRADKPPDDVLTSWRKANAEVRRRMRELGRDGTMSSSVGPYPVGLMGFHVASEYATHADDMAVPIDTSERDRRTAWREKVSLFALKESEKPVDVKRADDGYRVTSGDRGVTLSPADFVEAVAARLKTIDPELQEALRALA
jgi:uncharacterized protein (TIGR03083 family)